MESVGFFRSCQPARLDDEPDRLERLARYLTRAPIGENTVRDGFIPSGNRLSRGE